MTHGERFAAFIEDKPFIQRLLRPVFLRFADRGNRLL